MQLVAPMLSNSEIHQMTIVSVTCHTRSCCVSPDTAPSVQQQSSHRDAPCCTGWPGSLAAVSAVVPATEVSGLFDCTKELSHAVKV